MGESRRSESLRGVLRRRPRVIALLECPTPQRNPVMDDLAENTPLVAVYMEPGGQGQGWGKADLRHPHAFQSDSPWRSSARLAHYLVTHRDTVLMCFGVQRPIRISSLLIARALRIPVVTRSDSSLAGVSAEAPVRRAARKLWWRLLFAQRTRVWTIGEQNEVFWRGYIGLRNTHRIPYSMPVLPSGSGVTPRRRTSDALRLKFLYVGRISPEKRTDLLVDAFLTLPADLARHWSLDIVGDGAARAALQARVAGDPRVRLVGAVEHQKLDAYYGNADVHVLASDREPWGLVVNESMAFGLWNIVSDRVGSSELVDAPDKGAIFPAGDVNALMEAMKKAPEHLDRSPVPVRNVSDLMSQEIAMLQRRDES